MVAMEEATIVVVEIEIRTMAGVVGTMTIRMKHAQTPAIALAIPGS